MSTNFWKTLEVQCWSRGLGYNDYLDYHSLDSGDFGQALTASAYEALCILLDNQYEEEFQ